MTKIIKTNLFQATGRHLIQTTKGWKKAEDLQVGDCVVGSNGQAFAITKTTTIGRLIKQNL